MSSGDRSPPRRHAGAYPLREIHRQLDLCMKRSDRPNDWVGKKKGPTKPRPEDTLGQAHRCRILRTPPERQKERGAREAPIGTKSFEASLGGARMPWYTESVGGGCPTILDGRGNDAL